MTTGNTSLLKLALPVNGELDGTWGDVVNNSITSLVDTAVAGATTLSADADVTLSDTALASNQARQAILLWTAGGTTLRTITAPARSKTYVVVNATSGSQSIKLVGAGPTTGITVVAGERCVAAWNGSDFVKVATSLPTISLTSQVTGTLPVANGGTGVATLTGIAKGNGTGAFTAAVSGTDYAPATSGTSILYGNGSGGFSNVTVGSGVTFAGGTLSASGSGGTITSVTASSPLASSGGATPNISLTGTVAVANGGTGASDAATARSNLSVPSTTGSGASGTWGISISGNAATATSATSASTATTATSATSAGSLSTTNFTVAQSGSSLVISYNGTPVLSISSGGAITALNNVTAYGSP